MKPKIPFHTFYVKIPGTCPLTCWKVKSVSGTAILLLFNNINQPLRPCLHTDRCHRNAYHGKDRTNKIVQQPVVLVIPSILYLTCLIMQSMIASFPNKGRCCFVRILAGLYVPALHAHNHFILRLLPLSRLPSWRYCRAYVTRPPYALGLIDINSETRKYRRHNAQHK